MIRPIMALATCGMLLLVACKPGTSDSWTNAAKTRIETESSLPTDSAFTSVSPVGFEKVQFFSNGILTKEKWYHANQYHSAEVLYSNDGRFQLRRELCRDGSVSFEGIFFEGQACGLSTWWNCETHTLTEQGIRYKGKHIGFWTTQDTSGKTVQVNHGKFNLIDSLSNLGR